MISMKFFCGTENASICVAFIFEYREISIEYCSGFYLAAVKEGHDIKANCVYYT